MANNQKNQNAPKVVLPTIEAEVSPMEKLRASLAAANERRANAAREIAAALAIEKEFADQKASILDPLKKAAIDAINEYKKVASPEEMTVLHATLFPRQKSDKPRKPRASKKVVTPVTESK